MSKQSASVPSRSDAQAFLDRVDPHKQPNLALKAIPKLVSALQALLDMKKFSECDLTSPIDAYSYDLAITQIRDIINRELGVME